MITTNSVERAVQQLGIEITMQNGDELTGCCPLHEERTGKADRNPSWHINMISGKHICFSCGYKGGLTGLVADVLGLEIHWGAANGRDYDAAKEWLEEHAHLEADELLDILSHFDDEQPDVIPMSEARLAVYGTPIPAALSARGLTVDATDRLGIKWSKENISWIAPVRDPETFELWGWQEKGEHKLNGGKKWFKNQPVGIKKSRTLFGIDKVNTDRPVVVVESPLDVARLWTLGYPNGVAIMGSICSETQADLLRQFPEIVLAMDNPFLDESGKKSAETFLHLTKRYGLNTKFFNYSHAITAGKKDIGDMYAENVDLGLGNAVSWVHGLDAIYGRTRV